MLAAFGFPVAEHFHPLFGGNIDVPSCVEIKILRHVLLNHRVVLHAIDATPARWRGDAGSSPLDRARSAASSPRNDLVKNCRVHPTHWLISAQVPSYVAYQQTPLQTFWPVVLLYVGIVEIFSVFTFENPFGKGGFWTLKDDRVPGDFGWDPMDMYPTDPAGRVEMQTKELNNGRVAMIAMAGMVAQELATGAKLF